MNTRERNLQKEPWEGAPRLVQGKKRVGVEEDDTTYTRILRKVKFLPKQIEKASAESDLPEKEI